MSPAVSKSVIVTVVAATLPLNVAPPLSVKVNIVISVTSPSTVISPLPVLNAKSSVPAAPSIDLMVMLLSVVVKVTSVEIVVISALLVPYVCTPDVVTLAPKLEALVTVKLLASVTAASKSKLPVIAIAPMAVPPTAP